MKLLALSDIHHNLIAVRKLRASETNSFDAIIVAGDIGSKSAAEFFKILKTFNCPIFYVYGNWDHQLSYSEFFGQRCHLIHSNVKALGTLYFTGFSGCPTNWGRNPIAQRIRRKLRRDHKQILKELSEANSYAVGEAKIKRATDKVRRTKAYQQYALQLRLMKSEVLRLNRESVAKATKDAKVDPGRCIVVTHERLTHLDKMLPGTLLHLFGHIHQFSDHSFKGTRYIDVAALDRPLMQDTPARTSLQNGGVGNYVKIEIGRSLEIVAKPTSLSY